MTVVRERTAHCHKLKTNVLSAAGDSRSLTSENKPIFLIYITHFTRYWSSMLIFELRTWLQLCSIIGDVARSKSGMESSGQQIGVRGSHLPAKSEVWGEKNVGKSPDDHFGINVRPRQTSCVTDPPYPVNSPASQQRPPAKAGRTSTPVTPR